MELLQTIKLYFSQGIGILRIAYEHSPYDLENYGIVLPKAKEYSKLADALLGPADSPRLQREFLALAEQRELSLDHLVMVNRHAKKLKKRGAAWKLRAELIAHEGSYKEVNAYGNRRVKEIQGEKPKEPGVKESQAKNGMRTMTVTDTQRRITDFEKTLDAIESPEKPRKKHYWKRSGNTSTAAEGYSNRNTAPLLPSGWTNPRRSSAAKATTPSSEPPTAPP